MANDSPRRWPHLAEAADIIQWSDKMDARSELPRLIRTLIQHNNDQVVRLDMRSGEGVGVGGYDGIVQASQATPFVPQGVSAWEMGTDKQPGSKAGKDYRKRLKNLRGVDPAKTTYVSLTSRRWPGKTAWETARRAEGRWLDVRAFDVDDIELALEAAPAAHIRFSEVVGKPAASVQTLEDWWIRFSTRTSPPLTPALVLSGRSDAAAEMLRLLDEDRRFTTVHSRNIDDVLAFVVSAMMTASGDVRDSLLARALVVKDSAALRQLDGAWRLLILLPFEEAMRREAELVQSHHVIFLSVDAGPSDIDLPPIDHDAFVQLLCQQGLTEEQAGPLARAAHKSLPAYLRRAAPAGRVQVSLWSTQLRSSAVRRAWLAGAWNAERSGDVQVVSDLLGDDYAVCEPGLIAATQSADPILTRIGSSWAVISPEDSWTYCQPHVTSADLQALEVAVQTVLGAVDPALELDSDKRWMAAVYGKSRVHSSDLRKGLATTICLLGAMGDEVPLGGGRSGRTWAEALVFRLMDRANADTSAQLWTSLADVLPLLAEASPDVFLRSVQSAVSEPDPLLRSIFCDDTGDSLTLSSPHTGLLWALELLAWSPDHFALAVEALTRLAEIDPGGRLSNRPARSLADIFRPWLPQTSASHQSRLTALDSIVARHFEVGRALLFALLPEHSMVGMYSYAPRFRKWKPKTDRVPATEYLEFVTGVGQRLLKMANDDPTRWVELVPRLADLPPDVRASVLADLSALQLDSLSQDARMHLWNQLTGLERSHREFAGAKWALPAADLDELSKISSRLDPMDPARRFGWLFDSYAPDLGIGKHTDHDAYQQELVTLRTSAAAEIANAHGLAGLLELAARSEAPGSLGFATASADTTLNPDVVVDLLDSVDSHAVAFATGYVRRASGGTTSWLGPAAETRDGRPVVQARLLLCCDELEAAWEAAARLGRDVDDAYWEEFNGFGRGSDFGLVNEVAKHMIAHGRAAAALDFVNVYSDRKGIEVEAQLVVEAFEAVLGGDDHEIGLLSSYDIWHLLEFLRNSTIDEDQLAMLEWRLLPASDAGIGPTSPILERKLSRDPAFFVQIVSMCYKPHGSDQEREIAPHVAQNAYRLLEHWNQPPGSDEPGGVIDQKRLDTWVDEARRLLKQADRAEIGEHLIGNILAHSPKDEDGTWPAKPVRELIEQSASVELEAGFRTGTYNMRGVTSRGLTDGGAQEYALAKTYSERASFVKDGWPRTASVLRSLADGYTVEGKMHDEEAERFREGLER